MGLIKELLGQVKDNQRYAREHPRTYQDDYSSSSSRPKKVYYVAYCRICGASMKGCDSRYYLSPEAAIRRLQEESGSCGRGNHSPQIRETDSCY